MMQTISTVAYLSLVLFMNAHAQSKSLVSLCNQRTARVTAHVIEHILVFCGSLLNINCTTADTPVSCHSVGSGGCSAGNVDVIPYAQCCSQPGAANIYYNESDGQCTKCGKHNNRYFFDWSSVHNLFMAWHVWLLLTTT